MIERFVDWAGLPPMAQKLMESWEMRPLLIDGEVRAIAALSGTEIHFAIDPDWRGRVITRRRVREFLGPLLEEKSFLSTTSLDGANHDFLTRLGFVPTWTDGERHHYMMTDIPFQCEVEACQPLFVC